MATGVSDPDAGLRIYRDERGTESACVGVAIEEAKRVSSDLSYDASA